MANMSQKKTPMPTLPPEVRAHSFQEVTTGYSEQAALNEAQRCLNCKAKPCVAACPVQIDIPGFIQSIRAGQHEAAYDIISRASSLPAVCGRVCPQESQCESACTRGIKGEPVAIGRLERFAADRHNEAAEIPAPIDAPVGQPRIAVIGSGPAGLACASALAKEGYAVTIFEALHLPGGVLSYGIPEFRLPKAIVAREIAGLRALGVQIETNTVVGKTLSIDELQAEFDAIFVGTGAGLPRFMNIPGENLQGVYSANEFLTRINLMKAYQENAKTPILNAKRVVVVGGGNVAMDAARCALRMGAQKVTICYRRSLEELPARREEVEHAMEEGVIFDLLTNPTRVLGYENPDNRRDPRNGFVTGLECVRMQLGEPDASGRRRPVELPDSAFLTEADCVIMALGTSPNPLLRTTTDGLRTNSRGCIVVNEDGLTSLGGVYAGGDAVTGAATVILAMGAGKKAAAAISEQLRSRD